MLNEALGARGIEVQLGRHGCALYGPYEEAPSGHLRVAFRIVPLGPLPPDDPIVAYVDVVGNFGRHYFAADFVLASELCQGGVVTLDAALPEPNIVEYRVHSTGAVALFIADAPVVTPIEQVGFIEARLTQAHGAEIAKLARVHQQPLEHLLQRSGPPPAADEREVGRELRAALGPLRPHHVPGWDKQRIGSTRDGGYVCIPDFDGVDAVLSFGISDNVDFDEDVAARGAAVYQYDHTVDDPRPNDPRLVFHKKMIGVEERAGIETLPALVRRHDRGQQRPNIFLKIDIEGWEWPVFDEIDEADLGRIRQITGEFHGFEFFRYPVWRERMVRAMTKVARRFALVHVHANNCASTTVVDGIMLPNVLELTFLNRACYATEPSGERFPSVLDMA